LVGVDEDWAVEFMHFPAGIVDRQDQWSCRMNSYDIRDKTKVFRGEDYGLSLVAASDDQYK
jgi:hypothetical protein